MPRRDATRSGPPVARRQGHAASRPYSRTQATEDSHPGQRSYLRTRKEGTAAEPKSADLIATEPTAILPWERAVLADARVYWLATVPAARAGRHTPLIREHPRQPEPGHVAVVDKARDGGDPIA